MRAAVLAGCAGVLATASPSGAADQVFRPSWSQATSNDDMPGTVAAPEDASEHRIVYDISRKKAYSDFRKLLPVIAGTNIRVFAAVQSWTTACAVNGWLDFSSLPPGRSCDCKSYPTPDGRQRCKTAWLVAWKRAASAVSKLAKAYPANLKGFVIDDFDLVAESDDISSGSFSAGVTRHDLRGVADAVHSIHPELELWTTATYGVWSVR